MPQDVLEGGLDAFMDTFFMQLQKLMEQGLDAFMDAVFMYYKKSWRP